MRYRKIHSNTSLCVAIIVKEIQSAPAFALSYNNRNVLSVLSRGVGKAIKCRTVTVTELSSLELSKFNLTLSETIMLEACYTIL